MVRLIQHKILTYDGKDTLNTNGWESGLSADLIKEALNSWQTFDLGQGYLGVCMMTKDLKHILEVFGINFRGKIVPVNTLRLMKQDWIHSKILMQPGAKEII
jgi:hypothetical protein